MILISLYFNSVFQPTCIMHESKYLYLEDLPVMLIVDLSSVPELSFRSLAVCDNHYLMHSYTYYYTVEPCLTDTPQRQTCTCDITDNSECPDCISIDVNIFKPLQQQTPRYSVIDRSLINTVFFVVHSYCSALS